MWFHKSTSEKYRLIQYYCAACSSDCNRQVQCTMPLIKSRTALAASSQFAVLKWRLRFSDALCKLFFFYPSRRDRPADRRV